MYIVRLEDTIGIQRCPLNLFHFKALTYSLSCLSFALLFSCSFTLFIFLGFSSITLILYSSCPRGERVRTDLLQKDN